MKLILKTAALAAAFTLTACGGGDKGEQQGNASNAAEAELNDLDAAAGTLDNVADNATGNVSDAISNQADAVSNAADTQRDALENASTNTH